MDISWDNQKCPKNGGIFSFVDFGHRPISNEIFSAEKWLKHKYPKVWSVDFSELVLLFYKIYTTVIRWLRVVGCESLVYIVIGIYCQLYLSMRQKTIERYIEH